MNGIETVRFRRVSKPRARKMYGAGTKIYVLPCRLHPDNIYERPVLLGRQACDEETGRVTEDSRSDFETAVRAFEFYNCCNAAGRYAAFYVRKV